MIRRLGKLLVALGVLGGIAYAISRATRTAPSAPGGGTTHDRDAPPKPSDAWTGREPAVVTAVASAPWVEPVDGACPTSHPVKGKLKSKIFHLPGMLNYERTAPDRCYLDPAAAEADGLRVAKR